MQEQNDKMTGKPVEETGQKSQENQMKQHLKDFATRFNKIEPKRETFTLPPRMAWDTRDILSTVERLQGILSQEDLWRGKEINICMNRIWKAAQNICQYFL